MNTLFLCLLAWHVAFLALHDWVPLGRLNDVAALRRVRSLRARVLASLLMGGFSGWALVLNWRQSPHPGWDTRMYTLVLFCVLVVGAVRAWWLPYFTGKGLSPQFLADYDVMFRDTVTFLPVRHGMTVNALHCFWHGTALVTVALAAMRMFA